MTEVADRYRRRADAFGALIAGTAPERWSTPSPCEGWTARDVVAHVVDFSAQVLREQAGVSGVAVWNTLSQMRQSWWDWHHSNGWYAPAVPVPEDAPLQDRVLGLIGRRPPRWPA